MESTKESSKIATFRLERRHYYGQLFRSLDQEMNFANTNGQTLVNLINVSQSHFRYNEIHVS